MPVDPNPTQQVPVNPGIGPPFNGLYLDRPAHLIPPNGFSACNNLRIRQNRIDATQMGWTVQLGYQNFGFGSPSTPGEAICGGGLLTLSFNGFQYLVIANTSDLYAFASGTAPPSYLNPAGVALFITPVYITGTCGTGGVSSTTLTGVGTHWNTAIGTGFRKNARAGDYIFFGSTGQNSPSAAWVKITAVASDTSLTLATAQTVANGTSYTLRQCMANNTTDHRVVAETYPNAAALGPDFTDTGDMMLFANYGGTVPTYDPMVEWNPKNVFATYLAAGNFISASGFINCGALRRFNNVMCYGRLIPFSPSSTTSILGTEMASSDNGDPRTFTSGIAFQGVVSDGAEPISHLGILGNSLLIYCGSLAFGGAGANTTATAAGNIISASFVGAPTVWQFQTVIRNRGPIGQRLIAEFADRHEFIGVDSQYRYNGLYIQAMNDQVWRELLRNPSTQLLPQAFHIHAPSQGEVWWMWPDMNEAGTFSGYVEHYMEQANQYLFKPVTKRDVSYTDTAFAGLQTFTAFLGANPSTNVFQADYSGPIVGDSEGNVLTFFNSDLQQIGNAGVNTDMVRTCTFGSRVVAGERSRGLIKRIYPFVDASTLLAGATFNITITLTMQDRIGGTTSITETDQYVVTAGTLPTNRFVTPYRRGRVAQLKFSAGTAGAHINPTAAPAFALFGYDWDTPGPGSAGSGGKR